MATKAEALAALDAGYRGFREPIAALDDAAYAEPWLGTWGLSQCLAHMEGWYREMTAAIERVGRGERAAPEGVDYSSADTWNEKFALQARSGRAALDAWDEAYRGYRDAASALPDTLFGDDAEKGRPLIGNRLLQSAGIHHFEEHQPELEKWLSARK